MRDAFYVVNVDKNEDLRTYSQCDSGRKLASLKALAVGLYDSLLGSRYLDHHCLWAPLGTD